MREIVPVAPGKTYIFRLINGGVHYGLRINIGSLKMTIIAADSEPVEPVVVDEVFLHVAERFDVEVTVPEDWKDGSSFWIRADTIESAYQGYQNGVRAILSVSGNKRISQTSQVQDPEGNIFSSPISRSYDHLIMNCFERKTFDGIPNAGKCLSIDTLSHRSSSTNEHTESFRVENADAEVHLIDSHFQPYPQVSQYFDACIRTHVQCQC